jgi:hypothetical protein
MKLKLGLGLAALVLVAGACGDDEPSPPGAGQIGVTTVTTGSDMDDSYGVTVDGNSAGTIGANDELIVEDQPPGAYQVALTDVAANCTVGGDNPRTVTVVAGATEQTTFNVSCTALNQPPVADAGPDQTVTDTDDSGSEDVTLDGSASTDPDGTIASWSWAVEGTEIATGETATVPFDVGTYTVVLTVTDDGGATGTDDVMITVEAPVGNQPPTADAGPDQTVTDADNSGSEDVTLDGSASTDVDGTIASWSWTENSVEIATGANPTVAFDVGAHTVTLTVTDDEGATGTDDVVITVNSPTVFFATDIQPYFDTNCTACHGASNQFAGVRLDSYAAVLTDGNNGPLVVPGDSGDPSAILVPKLESGHQGAPHGTNIIQDLKDWIDEGALDN